MKRKIFILNTILLMGCFSNDIISLPQNINESHIKKLLIDEYIPTNNSVFIGSNKYSIKEAWTTYNFISNKSTLPNKNIIYFVIRLINNSNNKEGLNINEEINYPNYIYYESLEENVVGINSNKLVIHFNSLNIRKENLDTIKLVFKNDSTNISEDVYFVRQKRCY